MPALNINFNDVEHEQNRGNNMKKILPHRHFLASLMNFIQVGHAKSSNDETTMKDVNQQTKELLSTLKQYGSDKREEAIKKTTEALIQLDHRMDRLETRMDNKWDEMDETARKKARSTLRHCVNNVLS